jgi:aminoglycoside phosphotransferase (APT) family kinase protein
MHDDEIELREDVARRLLEQQFPQWAALPLARVPTYGTDNVLFRLGDELQLRLPRLTPDQRSTQIAFEAEWLPRLRPHLPVEIPELVAIGEPSPEYAHRWAVYRWLDGAPPVAGTVELARDLAAFIAALQRCDTARAPAGRDRGGPLELRDRGTRRCLEWLDDERATAVWEAALAAPPWDGEPVWLHGDLLEGNLLVRDGRLAAVIDWGCARVGDPAFDYIPAWSLLAPVRDAFRAATGVDDATWTRARGLAVSQAVIALPYYLHISPPIVERSRRVIKEATADADL